MSYARIRILGKLGSDPDIKTSTKGKRYARLSLCVNDPHNKNTAEWYQAICWGIYAKVAEENLAKGMEVEIYGYPHLSTYTNQQGVMRAEIQVKVIELHFVSSLRKPSGFNPDEKF